MSNMSQTEAPLSKANRMIFSYENPKPWPKVPLLIFQLILPFFLLTITQTIAVIVPTISAVLSGSFMDSLSNPSSSSLDTSSIMEEAAKVQAELMQTPSFIIAMGVSYIILIGIYILIVKAFEKRSLATLGFPLKNGAGKVVVLKSYLMGLVLGVGLMGMVYLLQLLTGQLRLTGMGLSSEQLIIFAAYIFMWIPQGAAEEVMTRGYMLPRLAVQFSRVGAVIISSLYFSFLHLMNTGVTPLAVINLALVAVFFACLALYSQHIWTVCACHSFWNLSQGNIFGLSVSGGTSTASILQNEVVAGTNPLLNGGEFGPEGSILTTIVLGAALMVLLLLGWNKIKNKQRV